MKKITMEPQYQYEVELREKLGTTKLGLGSNSAWHFDPKRLLFLLARYKFVSKMLQGKQRVLEVGCGDGFGTRIVQQTVGHVTATDFDPLYIQDALDSVDAENWPVDFAIHNYIEGPFEGEFDAAYSLDVLEHILQEDEAVFIQNAIHPLTKNGVFVVGMPSLESQDYACEASKEGHVNCKNGNDLKRLMETYFENVFLFSMNDEVVHTGFTKMAHYVIAVCVGKKMFSSHA